MQQIEGAVRICKEFGRKVATAEEARQIMKIGIWYDSVEETLQRLEVCKGSLALPQFCSPR